ncbi:PLP-dependent aminotransferase family protein [Amycolatopsis sp. NPDC051102]|uniref:MocR-like pyridoxine biosynthesis transcription factor PdxR n=1 Tax=Amycolatopsis sp. NPDC051102 TaxID=3155163 RepID=UPI00341A9706
MDRAKTSLSEGSIGSDFLQLDVREAPPGGLADWLAGQLRAAIADGRLPVGGRLPASRVLAAELCVSRGVVTEAYQRLIDDGHAAGRGRAGTVVVAAPVLPPDPVTARPSSLVITRSPGLQVFDEVRAAPARIDLTPGVPDLTAFPRAAWLRAERAVLDELEPAHFGYGDPGGAPSMRLAVSRWLARNRGIRVDPGQIIVVAGVAQALTLLGEVLRQHGLRSVAAEDPGSLGARQHLQHCGLATPPVPVDEDGVRVASLQAEAVLLTPAHQFPTGVVLGGERRRELMNWAAAGGIVLEDDYDAEHRYDRAPVPAVRSMLPDVCYMGSVSKLLAPALRVGWLLAPPRFFADLVAAKRFADLGNPVLAQLVLARLMETGELERQLRVVRTRHRRRRDAMIRAVASDLPGAVVHGAAAGLHLTITFDEDVDDVAVAAAALGEGVKVQPLSWHRQQPGRPGLVLGYAARTATEIAEGIAVLGRLVTS